MNEEEYITEKNEEDWHDYLNNIGYHGVCQVPYYDHFNKINTYCTYPADQFDLIIRELQRCFKMAPHLFTKHIFESGDYTESDPRGEICKICGMNFREGIHIRS